MKPNYTDAKNANATIIKLAGLEMGPREMLSLQARRIAQQRLTKAAEKIEPREFVPTPVIRARKEPRPCHVTSFTFSTGEVITRCLGVFEDGRECSYAQGSHYPETLNCPKHRPADLGANVVGEIFADRDETVPESTAEPTAIEGVLEEIAPEPVEAGEVEADEVEAGAEVESAGADPSDE
jgi:hypothetical protein